MTAPQSKLIVCYCPECDGLHVLDGTGFVFKDEGGEFYLAYERPIVNFRTHKLYIVDDL